LDGLHPVVVGIIKETLSVIIEKAGRVCARIFFIII